MITIFTSELQSFRYKIRHLVLRMLFVSLEDPLPELTPTERPPKAFGLKQAAPAVSPKWPCHQLQAI